MYRYILVAGILFGFSLAMVPNAPAIAITAKQKMDTCKFGADHPEGGGPKLVGRERTHFIDKCMSNKNDPRGPAVGTPTGQGAPKS